MREKTREEEEEEDVSEIALQVFIDSCTDLCACVCHYLLGMHENITLFVLEKKVKQEKAKTKKSTVSQDEHSSYYFLVILWDKNQ